MGPWLFRWLQMTADIARITSGGDRHCPVSKHSASNATRTPDLGRAKEEPCQRARSACPQGLGRILGKQLEKPLLAWFQRQITYAGSSSADAGSAGFRSSYGHHCAPLSEALGDFRRQILALRPMQRAWVELHVVRTPPTPMCRP